MGARVNYIFDDGSEALPVLYSHWGADSIEYDLNSAFFHADTRKGDNSYWTRMVISYLLQDELMSEYGFGIFAISREQIESLNNLGINVVIDVENATWKCDEVYA